MTSGEQEIQSRQKLYRVLKSQYEEELKEVLHYLGALTSVNQPLIREYLQTLASDGVDHIKSISSIMVQIEGASGSSKLSKKGIAESIEHEKLSADALSLCAEMVDDPSTKEIIEHIIKDEARHVRILEHIDRLLENSSKK